MCVSKVYVRDLLHLHKIGNYFECGHCIPCLQRKATRRANKIRQHEHKGTICYFVTLTYTNECLPYVRRDELLEACYHARPNSDNPCPINVYRDKHLVRGQRSSFLHNNTKVIGQFLLEDDISNYLLQYAPIPEFVDGMWYGIRTKLKFNKYIYDPVKISVAFIPDIQTFLKRLRYNLSRQYPGFGGISYYSAPEYGPTSQRYHIHLLIWFPSTLSKEQVQSLILKSWPFCDKARLCRGIEIARSPANYLASYVNSDSSISRYLLKFAPLRTSHSLGFGFNENIFDFENILKGFKDFRRTFYTVTSCSPSTGVQHHDIPYPKYILYRYFPKCKGFNRITFDAFRRFVYEITNYVPFFEKEQTLSLSSIDQTLLSRYYASGRTEAGVILYHTSLTDVYGINISMTKVEIMSFRRRIIHYLSYFNNTYDALYLLYRFYIAYNSYIISSMYKSHDNLQYFNLADVINGDLYADIHIPDYVDVEYLPFERSQDLYYIEKFEKNIKKRKLNSYG
ncbi:replication initiator protein [Sigmofec virus UA08Rod_4331]|uniref:Replication initiator protein n=1 Tax=Sigmofec virus UA08Rod_4331 TaxID=2929399 RepID=A0A976N123_9VIRU|nr:replication initiator protein [Sigmofec virus UA08Rod_4331]